MSSRWERRAEKKQALRERMPKHGRSLKTLAAESEAANKAIVEIFKGQRFNYQGAVYIVICSNKTGTKWKCHLENFPSITLWLPERTVTTNLIPSR